METETEVLKKEKAHLLEELSMAYLQMQKVLDLADQETSVAYDVLRQKNDQLHDQLNELREAHEQLQNAQRMLLRAERMSAMGQMAATIVHEINSPLAVIAGQAELIMMREGGDVDESDVKMIIDATHRLSGLTRNILRFARRSYSDVHAVDVNEIVSETLEFLTPLMKQVVVDKSLADELPPVRAYPAHIEQVLTNLLTNAMDAVGDRRMGHIVVATGTSTIQAMLDAGTAEGKEVHLTLSIPEEVSGQEYIYLSVSDDGPGIESEKLASIFDAFYTTKPEDKGTGLGLAISREIAEGHGGDILVSTRVGGGTSFRLLLPVADGADE